MEGNEDNDKDGYKYKDIWRQPSKCNPRDQKKQRTNVFQLAGRSAFKIDATMAAAHSYDEFLKILTRLHRLLHQPPLGVCAAVHVLLPLVVIQGNFLL